MSPVLGFVIAMNVIVCEVEGIKPLIKSPSHLKPPEETSTLAADPREISPRDGDQVMDNLFPNLPILTMSPPTLDFHGSRPSSKEALKAPRWEENRSRSKPNCLTQITKQLKH